MPPPAVGCKTRPYMENALAMHFPLIVIREINFHNVNEVTDHA